MPENFNFIRYTSKVQVSLKQPGSVYTCIFFSKYLYGFRSMAGSPQMRRACCMHWPMPFYIGNLSIQGFWYSRGSWNQTSVDKEGQPKFWGSQVIQILTKQVSVPLNPLIIQGSTVTLSLCLHSLSIHHHTNGPTFRPTHIPKMDREKLGNLILSRK